jgi:hypothetical protein
MPRRQVRRQGHAAEGHLIQVSDDPIRLGGLVGDHVVAHGQEVALAPTRQEISVRLAHHDPGTGEPLDQRMPACVIDVRVAVQQELDVLEPEPERPHALPDERNRLGEPAVEQEVPLRCGDQEQGDVRGPDIVDVPDHPEGLERVVYGP